MLPFEARAASIAARAAAFGFKPPWDDSPPPPLGRIRSLAAEELAKRAVPGGSMTSAALQHLVETVTERVRSTGRRVERAVLVLEAAGAHAQQRYSDEDDCALDRLSGSFVGCGGPPSPQEYELMSAAEHLGRSASSCEQAASAHRERLLACAHRLVECVHTLESHAQLLEHVAEHRPSLRQRTPTSGNDRQLFRLQAEVRWISNFESHVRSACVEAMEVTRQQSSRVERAAASRNSAVHGVLSSPQRLSPEARWRAEAIGVDEVVACAIGSPQSGGGGAEATVPLPLLRGCYLGDHGDDGPGEVVGEAVGEASAETLPASAEEARAPSPSNAALLRVCAGSWAPTDSDAPPVETAAAPESIS